MNRVNVNLKRIKLLICDVDGVLTDGTVYIGTSGEEFKRYSIHDGMGIALARAAELPLALISGRFSESTAIRAKELKINDVYNGTINKLIPYNELKKKYNLTDQEVAYVGDDLIDIPLLKEVGFPVAVRNAFPEVKDVADYITETSGGEGVLREVISYILKGQDRYDAVVEHLASEVFKRPGFD